MAMEPGGRADKLGNEYERLWVVYQLLCVLRNEVTAVTWEPAGQDAEGIDVLVGLPDGTQSHQSCKRENAGYGKWTLSHLRGRGVLDAAKSHLSKGPNHRFVFVSRDRCPELYDLAARAGGCGGQAHVDYDALPAGLRRCFHQLGQYWGFDPESSPADRATVFRMLTACETRADDIKLLEDHVRALAESTVDADPDVTRTLLADFAVHKLGTRLDRKQLEELLKTKNLALRGSVSRDSIKAAIQSLQTGFIDSIKAYLIRDQLIRREEATRLIDAVTANETDRPRLVMVHGRAGIGKSGVLFELAHALQERGVPFLPIRLDRKVPVGSADRFGRDVCGLHSSPARTLESFAGRDRSVLILDQLDALRWTATHTDRPMDVVTEIVREALNPLCRADITVVIVCRTFDLEDDPRIAHLKSLAKLVSIEIGLLTPDATRNVVNSGQDVWASLSEAQQCLLQQPQALYLWTRLKGSGGGAPIFRTHTDLMRAFWDDLFQQRRPQNVAPDDLKQVLDQLVAQMDRAGRLTAPASLIHASKADVVRFLQSSGILRVDDRSQCVFTHQSYFDFLVADDLNRRLLSGAVNLSDWLHASDQSLFRRDQLRQVLALQRDDDPHAYLGAIEALLRDDQIRFHLKHLITRLLGQAEPPIPGEVDLIIRLLDGKEWREPIFGQVLWNKPAWFAALDERGLWARWLDSEDEALVDMALRMMGFMSRHFGDRLAALLRPYISRDDPWPQRVAGALTRGDMDQESDSVFGLRVALIRRGHNSIGRLWWEALAKKHPRRCMRLLELRLRLLTKSGRALRSGQSDELASTGIEANGRDEAKWLRKAAARCPRLVWNRVATICRPLARLHRWAQRNHDLTDFRSPTSQLSDQSRDAMKLCEQVLVAGGRSLARRRPQVLEDLVAAWDSRPHPKCIERPLLRSMEALPDSKADYAIDWLIAKSRRLRIGDLLDRASEQEPARRLIARFALHCSDPVASRLERAIFNYRDPDLKRMLKYDHERMMQGHYYPNHHGRAQYLLASAIPVARLTALHKDQLGVWQRKFGKAPLGRGVRSYGGFVKSTIPTDRLHRLTDEHWLRIAGSDWSEKRYRHKVMGPGHLGEAGHEHFANDMGAMARRQPSRFAKLALRLAKNAPSNYLQQILRAFEQKDPSDVLTKAKEQNKDKPERVPPLERELASWRSATREEIEAVIERVGFPEDSETAKVICWLIEKRDDIDWSQSTIDLVARLASTHPDPAPDHYALEHHDSHDRSKMAPDVPGSGLNCVRGTAALAMGNLLFADQSLYKTLKETIIALTLDANIAVRAAAVATCCPILNINRDQAVEHFLSICTSADDRVFLSQYLGRFLSCALWSHQKQLIPVVERMARSEIDEVAKRGAAWAAAAWVYKGWCDGLLADCRTGSPAQRQGVAEVAGQCPWESETADARLELLPAFFNDDDKDVRHNAAQVFWKGEPWQDDRLMDLALRFIESRAFAEDPTPIIHGLADTQGSLLRCAAVIHAVADQFAGLLAIAARDMSKGVAGDVPAVRPGHDVYIDNHDRMCGTECVRQPPVKSCARRPAMSWAFQQVRVDGKSATPGSSCGWMSGLGLWRGSLCVSLCLTRTCHRTLQPTLHKDDAGRRLLAKLHCRPVDQAVSDQRRACASVRRSGCQALQAWAARSDCSARRTPGPASSCRRG